MSRKARASEPGSNSTRSHNAARCSRSTDSSWRACPKVHSRNSVPIVDGAYTPSNRVLIPPLRTTSRSSMQSAPAHIPAISVASFGAGLAEPDLIRGAAMQTLSARSCASPVPAANSITGTSPAHDTRWSSSNTADAAVNLCDTCTGSALLNSGRLMREEHQSSQLNRHFPRINTPAPTPSIGGSRLRSSTAALSHLRPPRSGLSHPRLEPPRSVW